MLDDVAKAAENSTVYIGMTLEFQPTGGSCSCLRTKAGDLDGSAHRLQPHPGVPEALLWGLAQAAVGWHH